jgi:hypothetical protein
MIELCEALAVPTIVRRLITRTASCKFVVEFPTLGSPERW